MRRLGEKTTTKPRPEFGPFPRVVVELSRPEIRGVWVDGEPSDVQPTLYLSDKVGLTVEFAEGDERFPAWARLRAGDRPPNIEIRWEKE